MPALQEVNQDLNQKFIDMRVALNNSIVGRTKEIDACLIALVAKEHVLFVGPPGTAKSYLCNQIGRAVSGRVFNLLLGKFTEPDEVFGPVSVKSMLDDERNVLTEGYLPDADLAFMDEIWKASAAILNTGLGIMNERVFKNGLEETECPLLSMFAASNEHPVGEGFENVGAAYDRFLLRTEVNHVDDHYWEELLFGDYEPVPEGIMDINDVEASHDEAMSVELSEDTKECLVGLLHELKASGIEPGDRRIVKSIKLVKSSAWLNGRHVAIPKDVMPLKDSLWTDPKQHPVKTEEIVVKAADPQRSKINDLMSQFRDLLKTTGYPETIEVTATSFDAVKKIGEIANSLKEMGPDAEIEYTEISGIKEKMHEMLT